MAAAAAGLPPASLPTSLASAAYGRLAASHGTPALSVPAETPAQTPGHVQPDAYGRAPNHAVEVFLAAGVPVDIEAATRLRTLPWDYQQVVLAPGPLGNVRNPSACLRKRINDITVGVISFSKEKMAWQPWRHEGEWNGPWPVTSTLASMVLSGSDSKGDGPFTEGDDSQSKGKQNDDDIDDVMKKIMEEAEEKDKQKSKKKKRGQVETISKASMASTAPPPTQWPSSWRNSKEFAVEEAPGEHAAKLPKIESAPTPDPSLAADSAFLSESASILESLRQVGRKEPENDQLAVSADTSIPSESHVPEAAPMEETRQVALADIAPAATFQHNQIQADIITHAAAFQNDQVMTDIPQELTREERANLQKLALEQKRAFAKSSAAGRRPAAWESGTAPLTHRTGFGPPSLEPPSLASLQPPSVARRAASLQPPSVARRAAAAYEPPLYEPQPCEDSFEAALARRAAAFEAPPPNVVLEPPVILRRSAGLQNAGLMPPSASALALRTSACAPPALLARRSAAAVQAEAAQKRLEAEQKAAKVALWPELA